LIVFQKKSLKNKVNLKLIVGKNIYIRTISPGDVSLKYVSWLKNKAIMQYTEQNKKNHTLKTTVKFVEEKLKSKYDILFGIFLNHKHIGNVKLGPIDWAKQEAQISFFIGEKNFWGQGIMFKVIQKLLSFAFKTLGLLEIKAGYYKKNLASAKLFEKCKFTINKTQMSLAANNKKTRDIVYVSKKFIKIF